MTVCCVVLNFFERSSFQDLKLSENADKSQSSSTEDDSNKRTTSLNRVYLSCCPTVGCDGSGHVKNNKFQTHYR
jgi:hypothetical protein